tara:strand:- start:1932 stop:2144 length:213 start_codon:yes stop_codon:yes gene_type:complete
MKEKIGEYVRSLLSDGLSESHTVKYLICDIDEQLDVIGVESERKEKRLEKMREFLKTLPTNTTIETMSNW